MYKFRQFTANVAINGFWLPAADMWQHAYARRHDKWLWLQVVILLAIADASVMAEQANFFGWSTAVQIILISLVIMLPVIAYQTKPSLWSVVAIVMYTVSLGAANLYHVAFDLVMPWTPEIREMLADVPGSARGFALRLYQWATLLILALYATLNFFALWDKDLQTRMNWLILLIAEWFAVLEYAECRLFTDPFGSRDLYLAGVWGVEVAKSACGQKFGPGSDYIPPIVTTIFMIAVNVRNAKSHK